MRGIIDFVKQVYADWKEAKADVREETIDSWVDNMANMVTVVWVENLVSGSERPSVQQLEAIVIKERKDIRNIVDYHMRPLFARYYDNPETRRHFMRYGL